LGPTFEPFRGRFSRVDWQSQKKSSYAAEARYSAHEFKSPYDGSPTPTREKRPPIILCPPEPRQAPVLARGNPLMSRCNKSTIEVL
jgi:hypothetical protein